VYVSSAKKKRPRERLVKLDHLLHANAGVLKSLPGHGEAHAIFPDQGSQKLHFGYRAYKAQPKVSAQEDKELHYVIQAQILQYISIYGSR
jgi:hypothetical protein